MGDTKIEWAELSLLYSCAIMREAVRKHGFSKHNLL